MSEKKSLTVDKMNNGWVVWLIESSGRDDITNPRLCFSSDQLFSTIKEFFGVEELKHVNENVSQIYLYDEGFLVQYENVARPSIFTEL